MNIYRLNFLRKFKKALIVYKLPYEVKPPYTHIVQIGDPILRSTTQRVDKQNIQSSEMKKVMQLMMKIMLSDNLCGISAPQVGVPLRIMMIQCPMKFLLQLFSSEEIKERQMTITEPRVWINPEMKVLDYDTNTEPEMCGSVLGFQGDVKRYNAVQLSGLDERGQTQVVEATGYLARIIQHEIDHLNGVLYTDIMNSKSLRCSLWKEINILNGHVELSYYPKV